MRRPTALLLALATLVAVPACGDDDPAADLADERAEQVREVAVDAGLSDEVADLLALAARGTTATFQVAYAGSDGARIVISQDPPHRRIDIVAAGSVVESRVVRDGISYVCNPEGAPAPDAPLDCQRSDAAVDPPGAFSTDAIEDFAASLADATDRFDMTVEERTIADTPATCLTTAPRAGTPLDGTGPGVDTICVSPEGAQLLTDVGGERVVADTYSTDVPEGTFEV